MENKIEPTEAFPYKPPSSYVKKRYAYLFDQEASVPLSWLKILFDKLLAALLLLISIPILIVLKFAYVIEGVLIPENRGPMLFYYWAISEGRRIRKWKIRLIKSKFIDAAGAKEHQWIAYSAEWNESSRTYVGAFVKKYYLDEIPQFFSILIGDMTFVGPRPLSELHYYRDLAQRNVTRKIFRGGLLGYGHVRKGTPEMGKADFEYEYIDKQIKLSNVRAFLIDLSILYQGLKLVIKGGGY